MTRFNKETWDYLMSYDVIDCEVQADMLEEMWKYCREHAEAFTKRYPFLASDQLDVELGRINYHNFWKEQLAKQALVLEGFYF